jgi:hypothetical protein
MRIVICSRLSLFAPMELRLPDRTIRIKRCSSYEIQFTWPDIGDVCLHFPQYGMFQTPQWYIHVEGVPVCSGRMVNRTLRESILGAKLPFLEWNFSGATIYEEPTYCAGTIYDHNRRRLAFWRKRCRWQAGTIVVRYSVSDYLLCILCAMVLTSFWDLGNDSGGS